MDRVIASPAEKQLLAREHRAVAVDMESAALAEPCRQAGVPFGCVRCVLDDGEMRLSPRLSSLLSGPRVSRSRLLAAAAASPALLSELWRLRRLSRLASDQLGKALGELLTLTLDWAA